VDSSPAPGEISQVLAACRRDEPGAVDRLFPLVYDALHAMAHRQLGRQPDQVLNTTALLHEAYLKLVDQSSAEWQDRNHFLSVAAVAMRHILVDHARRRAARKRGGDKRLVPAEDELLVDHAGLRITTRAEEILAIHEALGALAELSERLVRLVELRFFGGLTVEETGQVMDLSERTVKRDWRKARAFLYRALTGRDAE
jgi:RNA polymerase sigma factor (TIGR02999 family)